MYGTFCTINVIEKIPLILYNRITLFMLIKGRKKATNVTMRNIKKFIDLEAQLKENLIFSFSDFLFYVIVFKRI